MDRGVAKAVVAKRFDRERAERRPLLGKPYGVRLEFSLLALFPGLGNVAGHAAPAREKRTCENRLTIRRDEVEAQVLKALQEKLLRQDLFDEFCEEFTREMNWLRMQHRASRSTAEREIERIDARRKKLIEMVMEGVVYRAKVTDLAKALQEPDSRSEATEALRGLVDAIVLTPDQAGEALQIELRGNLAATWMGKLQFRTFPSHKMVSSPVVTPKSEIRARTLPWSYRVRPSPDLSYACEILSTR